MRTIIPLFASLLLASTPFAHAADGAWSGNGPDGGSIGEILVDPSTPAILYAGTVGGLFKSIDSGANWTRAQSGLGGFVDYGNWQSMLLDSAAPSTLFAIGVGGSLFVSHDGATSWQPTSYSPAPGDWISAMAKVPGAAGALYIATSSGVRVSHDDGMSFAPLGGSGLPAGAQISTLAASPHATGVLLAYIYPEGIYRSSDGGAHWSLAQAATGYSRPFVFAFGAGGEAYLVSGNLYRSGNDGASWSAMASTGTGPVVAHPDISNLVYFVGDDGRVRVSIDGGATSTDISAGAVMANGTDAATIIALAIAPTATGVQYVHAATGTAGVFRRDAGGSWSATNHGLRASNIRALAPHPTMSGRVLAGSADATTPSPGIFLSTDAGTTWATSNAGLRALDVRSLTQDPTSTASVGSTTVYASGRGTISPDDGYPVNAGLYKSTDGGASWSDLGTGLPSPPSLPGRPYAGLVRSLVLDPRSCASPPPGTAPCTSGPLLTLYASASGAYDGSGSHDFRLIRSLDAGAHWSSIDGLPPDIDHGSATAQAVIPVPLAIDPLHPQRLYAGTFASFDTSALATPSISSGVFRSDDGGASWVLRSNGLPFYPGSATTHQDVLSLAINPLDPDVLWASAYTVMTAPAGYSHVYKTSDGGANWVDSSSGITAGDIRQIVVDPLNPAIVYAAATGYRANPAGVYRSSDGGASWLSISAGMQNAGPSSIAIDPADSSILYAGTPSGVWSLRQLPDADGDGAPDAVEQAGPNGGDANADGIADFEQANVASVGGAGAGQWLPQTQASQGGTTGYFTVSVIPQTPGTCAQAVDAQAIDAASRPADLVAGETLQHTSPLARFELLDCPAAEIELRFFDAAFTAGWSMRYYGPSTPGDDASIGWHDLGAIATRVDAQTWKLHLGAGSFGSYRPASANSILFEGGPAYSQRIFADGFD
jgi:hypothetical protein